MLDAWVLVLGVWFLLGIISVYYSLRGLWLDQRASSNSDFGIFAILFYLILMFLLFLAGPLLIIWSIKGWNETVIHVASIRQSEANIRQLEENFHAAVLSLRNHYNNFLRDADILAIRTTNYPSSCSKFNLPAYRDEILYGKHRMYADFVQCGKEYCRINISLVCTLGIPKHILSNNGKVLPVKLKAVEKQASNIFIFEIIDEDLKFEFREDRIHSYPNPQDGKLGFHIEERLIELGRDYIIQFNVNDNINERYEDGQVYSYHHCNPVQAYRYKGLMKERGDDFREFVCADIVFSLKSV